MFDTQAFADLFDSVDFVRCFFADDINGFYWFPYSIICLYMISPLLSLAVDDKRLMWYLIVGFPHRVRCSVTGVIGRQRAALHIVTALAALHVAGHAVLPAWLLSCSSCRMVYPPRGVAVDCLDCGVGDVWSHCGSTDTLTVRYRANATITASAAL